MTRRSWQKYLITVLRLLIAVGLLTFVLTTINWSKFRTTLAGASYPLLVAGFLFYLGAVGIQGMRLHALLQTDHQQWPLASVQRVNFVAYFFDMFSPGRLGSDAYRISSFRRQARLTHRLAVLVVLRIHGVLAAALIAGLALMLGHRDTQWWLLGAGMLIASVIGLTVLARGITATRWLEALAERTDLLGRGARGARGLGKSVRQIHARPATTISVLVMALAFVGTTIAVYWFVGSAFDAGIPIKDYILGVPVLMVAAAIPISIKGRGITEVLAIAIWQGGSTSREEILATVFAVFALTLVHGLVAGVVWGLTGNRQRIARNNHEHSRSVDEQADTRL